MAYDIEMKINSRGSVNDGIRVKVNFEDRGYNPYTDSWDDDWVRVMMPNGEIGNIEKSQLDIPPNLAVFSGRTDYERT